MCHYFATIALPPYCAAFPHTYIIYDVYNILIGCSNERELQNLYEDIMLCLPTAGLQIAKEKSDVAPI